jgi:hypothetical protein
LGWASSKDFFYFNRERVLAGFAAFAWGWRAYKRTGRGENEWSRL